MCSTLGYLMERSILLCVWKSSSSREHCNSLHKELLVSSQLLCWPGKERLWSHFNRLFRLEVKEVGDIITIAFRSGRISDSTFRFLSQLWKLKQYIETCYASVTCLSSGSRSIRRDLFPNSMFVVAIHVVDQRVLDTDLMAYYNHFPFLKILGSLYPWISLPIS